MPAINDLFFVLIIIFLCLYVFDFIFAYICIVRSKGNAQLLTLGILGVIGFFPAGIIGYVCFAKKTNINHVNSKDDGKAEEPHVLPQELVEFKEHLQKFADLAISPTSRKQNSEKLRKVFHEMQNLAYIHFAKTNADSIFITKYNFSFTEHTQFDDFLELFRI